jgi:hypothetical protein
MSYRNPGRLPNAIGTAQRELGDCPGGESPLGGHLIKLYDMVAKKAPNARIVVIGYPLLFEPPADTDLTNLAAKIRAINEATTDPNCAIERAVAAANEADVDIHYVDVTEEFAGHGIVIVNDVPPALNRRLSFIASSSASRPGRPARILTRFTRLPLATRPMPMPSPPDCQADG